jgi:hypothetical protein
MLNAEQIKLVQVACNKAGIRRPGQDGRYRLMLRQYTQPSGHPVESCKQLNNEQLDDILAICEAQGWRMPGQSKTFYRDKVAQKADGDIATFSQQQTILFLTQDLGFTDLHRKNFIKRMTRDKADSVSNLTRRQAWQITEALTAMIRRHTGINFQNLDEIRDYFMKEGVKDGQTNQI